MSQARPRVPREISEKDATGEIKALFKDIRDVLGTGITPLVFRLIADIPGGLSWCWNTIHPLYPSGVLPSAGRQLMTRIPSPGLKALPATVFEALGIDDQTLRTIGITLDHFNYSNPMNLLSLSVLLRSLEKENQTAEIKAANQRAVTGVDIKPPHDEPLLPMLEIGDMDDTTIALINELQKIGFPIESRPDSRNITRSTQGMASIWRILARWPAYLCIALVILQSQEAHGWIEMAKETVSNTMKTQVDGLLQKIEKTPDTPRPQGEALERMEWIIKRFTGAGLIRIIPVVKALQDSLPRG